MKVALSYSTIFILSIVGILIIGSCGKSGSTPPPPDPCSGVTITVNGTVSNPTATGVADGSINATASGSTGITFSLNGGAFQTSGSFSNLSAGTYTIIAKNGNGCSGSSSFTLTAANPCAGVIITVNAVLTNPASPGANNGNIVASASGSSGFTYNINGGAFQATGTFNNLAAGSYIIIAKNANGCTGTATFTLTNPNLCAGVTITVSNAITNNTPCLSPATGSITATPGGGTGPYTYKLNSGAYQSSTIFSNLNSGTYLITAKDANGCTGSANATVADISAGPLFAAVRNVLQNNCVSCHNNTQSEGGMNWTIDCNIVNFKDRIKSRAVDGIPSAMPPTGLLVLSEQQKIINWINAGGKYTD